MSQPDSGGHAFNGSTHQAETGGVTEVNSRGYTKKSCLKKTNKTKSSFSKPYEQNQRVNPHTPEPNI